MGCASLRREGDGGLVGDGRMEWGVLGRPGKVEEVLCTPRGLWELSGRREGPEARLEARGAMRGEVPRSR